MTHESAQLAFTNERPLVSCIKLLVARNPHKWQRINDLLNVHPELMNAQNLADEDPNSIVSSSSKVVGEDEQLRTPRADTPKGGGDASKRRDLRTVSSGTGSAAS